MFQAPVFASGAALLNLPPSVLNFWNPIKINQIFTLIFLTKIVVLKVSIVLIYYSNERQNSSLDF